ncbi:MAG: hypothetical protein M0P64_02755 [Candidatus Pacebacteria bacterium]|jgi:hypothetical protein|nr:hypothetical protein [Candidatus Paceibacterota bacterium]
MNNKKIILIGVGGIIAALLCVLFFNMQKSENLSPQSGEQTTISAQPVKTDFGISVPADFPADIPTEKGAKVEQSYSLNYANQKQLTIVFLSAKTVKENYNLYADFLKKQNWSVANTYEGIPVSSLYATKENNDINITISENISTPMIKSQVSISVLKNEKSN